MNTIGPCYTSTSSITEIKVHFYSKIKCRQYCVRIEAFAIDFVWGFRFRRKSKNQNPQHRVISSTLILSNNYLILLYGLQSNITSLFIWFFLCVFIFRFRSSGKKKRKTAWFRTMAMVVLFFSMSFLFTSSFFSGY